MAKDMSSKKKKGSGSKRRKDEFGNILYPGEYYYPQKKSYEYKFKNIYNQKDSRTAKTLDKLRQIEESIEAERSQTIVSGNSDMTVEELLEIYLRSKKKIAATTLTGYWNNYRLYIHGSWLGAMAIGKVLKLHLVNFYNELIETKSLSKRTIELINNIISPSFRLAIDSRWLTYNPCLLVMKDVIDTQGPDKNTLSKKQQIIFLQYVKQHCKRFDYNLIYIMTYFGLRIGEVLGMNLKELDLEHKRFNLEHQLIYKKLYNEAHTRFQIRPPKTMNGIRYMYFYDSEVVRCIQDQIEYATYISQISGKCVIDGETDFLFVTAKGLPITPGSVNRLLDTIIKKYNSQILQEAIEKNEEATNLLPHLSSHSLRRTGLTRMAESKMSPKILQFIAGHSDISITLQYYVTSNDDVLYEEMGKYAEQWNKRQINP